MLNSLSIDNLFFRDMAKDKDLDDWFNIYKVNNLHTNFIFYKKTEAGFPYWNMLHLF